MFWWGKGNKIKTKRYTIYEALKKKCKAWLKSKSHYNCFNLNFFEMFSDILTPSKFYLSTMIGFLKNWTNKCLYGFQCNHWNMQVNHEIKIIETNFTFLIGFTDVIDNCVKSTDFKLKKNYCNIAVQCIFVHMYSVCQSNFDLTYLQ